MAADDAGERSEQATAKRLKEARDKGQIARSKEVTTAFLLMASAVLLYVFSDRIGVAVANVAKQAFSPDRNYLFSSKQMLAATGAIAGDVLWAVGPVLAILLVITLASSILLGGASLSTKAMAPKFDRMSPAKGFKRMFGTHALVELVKALAKVSVVFVVGYFVLVDVFPDLLNLGTGDLMAGVKGAITLVMQSFFLLSLSLLLIAFIDVPYQLWNHAKQLKMTKQEVKDEYKETEGKPEVKSKIRQAQREMAQRRMMEAIPDADVVVTNPEHYSVAIKYDPLKQGAPLVVAKGVDVIAMQIRKVAIANDVPLLAAPPLARAIYHTTEIGHEVPQGLYLAVAQVLAYIFQLKRFSEGKAARPKAIKDLPIPDDFNY